MNSAMCCGAPRKIVAPAMYASSARTRSFQLLPELSMMYSQLFQTGCV
jgi:hypothetical protein